MTIKDRLTKLEKVCGDDDAVQAITYLIEDEPIELFEIRHDGKVNIIERLPDESEQVFMMRATEIRDSLITRSNGDTAAPIPIMMQMPLHRFDESRVTRG